MISSILNIFKPAADLIDNLHTSEEEKGQIKTKLAEIEAKVATRLMDLQSKVVDSNAKIAVAEQEHGNTFVKMVRPIISLGCFSILMLTGFEVIPEKELILQICGGYLGFYGYLRTTEKKK